MPAKRAARKRTRAAKRATTKRSTKRASSKRATTNRASTKRVSSKRATTKRATTKRAATKRASTKRATTKRSTKRSDLYGKAAVKSVERTMRRRKKGTLRSSSGEKVKDPKQAIAIALSEARRKGAKVPPPPNE